MHIFSPISDIFPLIYLKQTKLQKVSGWMKKKRQKNVGSEEKNSNQEKGEGGYEFKF